MRFIEWVEISFGVIVIAAPILFGFGYWIGRVIYMTNRDGWIAAMQTLVEAF